MKKLPRSKAQRKSTRKAQHAAVRHEKRFGPSSAQIHAARHNLRVARRAQKQRRSGQPVTAGKATKKPKLSPYEVNCCAAEAVAVTLRLTGVEVPADDMLELYWRVACGPEEGAYVADILRAARAHGLCGWFPSYGTVPVLTPGSIVVFDSWEHAAVLAGDGGVISWGERLEPPAEPFAEAWRVWWDD